MKLKTLSVALLVTTFAAVAISIVIPAHRAFAADDQMQTAVTQEIEQMEAKLTAATRAHDMTALDQLYWENVIDIHASGWTYTKSQDLELSRNLGQVPGVNKVIKTNQIGRKVVVFNKDAAEVVWENETYFEVPDPEQVALQAGVLTEDPKALAAAAASRSAMAPGDGLAPNPYRVRNTRLWVRFDGQWKVASSTSTRIGDRVVPGRF